MRKLSHTRLKETAQGHAEKSGVTGLRPRPTASGAACLTSGLPWPGQRPGPLPRGCGEVSRERRKGVLCGQNSGSKSLVSWKNGEEAWGLERSRVGTAVEGDLGGDGRSCIAPGPKEPQWFQAKEEGLIPSLQPLASPGTGQKWQKQEAGTHPGRGLQASRPGPRPLRGLGQIALPFCASVFLSVQ